MIGFNLIIRHLKINEIAQTFVLAKILEKPILHHPFIFSKDSKNIFM